jgi:hypothetical protein
MSDEQLIDVIASVCGFDRAGVERWRTEALIVGRAVEQASRRSALEEAAQVAYAHNAIMATTTAQLIENAIRALKDGQDE